MLDMILATLSWQTYPDVWTLRFWDFFAHSGFYIQYFHCLVHGNELVHNTAMTQRIESLPSSAIFMVFWLSFSNALSRRIVGFHDTCVL